MKETLEQLQKELDHIDDTFEAMKTDQMSISKEFYDDMIARREEIVNKIKKAE